MKKKKQVFKTVIGVIFILSAIYVAIVIVRTFLFDAYIVEGNSMLPTLRDGDHIYVDKTIIGARIYIPKNFKKREYIYFRTRGHRDMAAGDIAIFNFPCTEKDKLRFEPENILVKRCVGCPGDSIAINNGYYVNTNRIYTGIPQAVQQTLSFLDRRRLEDGGDIFSLCCIDTRWDIKDFGPLYIPGRGDTITLSSDNFSVYRTMIEYETGICPDLDDIGNKYIFNKDYYFFAGDNVFMSKDSRHFGLVPEDFIVGVVSERSSNMNLR